MSDEKYLEYLDNIEQYLNSQASYEFSSEFFAQTIVENIIQK